jgi:pilus assembly protein CpaB
MAMRGKSLALLVLALGCGLVASLGITQVMARRSGDPAVVSGETQSVVVVVKETGGGELLSAAALKLEQWPKDRAPAGSLSRIEDAEGRRTRTRVYVGEPIYENKIFPKGAGGDADGLIPKGYRVVAVNVDARSAT